MSEKNSLDIVNNIDNVIRLEKPWYRYGYLCKLHWFVFLMTLTSTNNGYDGSMLNGFQSLSSWNKSMDYPVGQKLGALSNAMTFGVVITFPFASTLSDKFGRKYCVMAGSFITIVGSVLQGCATNYAFFFCSRLIIGIGSGIATVSAPTMISELSYPSYRSYTTTFYNVCWYLGALIAAWLTYGTRNIKTEYSWKVPSFLQGLMPLIQILGFFFVPESPRFLVAKGRIEEAEIVLADIHTGNGTDDRSRQLVAFEIKEIQAALEMEKLTNHTKYTDFFTIPSFRKRLFLTIFTGVFMQLSGNGLVSYYLNKVLNSIGITGETEQLQINGGLMAYNLVIASAIAGYVGRFKRRHVFLFCISSMLISYIVWTALSAVNQQKNFEDKSYANGVLAMIFLYYFAYNTGANGLPFTYVTEILPYSHRAKGINIFQLTQQIVGIFNGYVNPIAMAAIEWKYYIVYCCWLTVELIIVYFFYVETSGFTLEEVAKVFDDNPDDFVAHLQEPGTKLRVEHEEGIFVTDSKEKSLEV